MRDSINLALAGKPCWVMDILYALTNLPFNVTTLNLTALTPQSVDDTIKSINRGLENHLQQIIDTSPKSYLLTGRMELDRMGKSLHKTLYFRNYLNVTNYKHRKAITKDFVGAAQLYSGQKDSVASVNRKLSPLSMFF